MKVLSTTRLPGPAWDELRDAEVGPVEGLRPDVEVLVVPNETVDDRVLDLLPGLRLVANFSVGYDRIDVAACAARGVAVTNTPGVVDAATADMAMALMLAARRRLVEGDRHVRAGDWNSSWHGGPFLGNDVSNSTLGVVGLGRIGRAVARRARAFDMRVLYAQRHEVETDLAEYRDLDDLLAQVAVVSLHVPLNRETTALIDGRRLASMRDGTTLVNTARGAVVDEPALVAELVSGRISAGLDVFAHEPSVPEQLLSLPNVVLAPHLGSATIETRSAMARIVVDNVLALERGEPLPNPVSA